MSASDPDLPELLDLDYGEFADDLALYESLARACHGPVLELGVGTGRVALHLARERFEVCGIDISEPSLARARCKAGDTLAARLRLERADMRDFDLGRPFELVFAAYGTFHHLPTPDDQLACLRCVARHLAPGGRFVCDLRPLLGAQWEASPLFHEWTRVLERTGETVTKLRAVAPQRSRQIQRETHLYDRVQPDGSVRRTVSNVDLRFTSRYEMEGLLREAGLGLEALYGDYELSPFDDESELMITFARKRDGAP
jgi:SAM-dependent methyltransferase